jgi:hypothetical protein
MSDRERFIAEGPASMMQEIERLRAEVKRETYQRVRIERDAIEIELSRRKANVEIERLRTIIDVLRKPLKIEVCEGQIGLALYVNDTRIAGPRHNGRMKAVLTGTYTIRDLN